MPAPYPQPQLPPKSGLAIASLICGILGFFTCGVTGLPAVITGHMALSSIKRAGGMIDGKGMAIGGLVTGYISFLIVGIAALSGLAAPVILKQRQAADRTAKMVEVQEISRALSEYKAKYASFPRDLNQLEAEGLITDLDGKLAVKKTHAGDWYYFLNPSVPSANDQPLLVSPEFGRKHLVILQDTTVRVIPEDKVLPLMQTGTYVKIPAPKR